MYINLNFNKKNIFKLSLNGNHNGIFNNFILEAWISLKFQAYIQLRDVMKIWHIYYLLFILKDLTEY